MRAAHPVQVPRSRSTPRGAPQIRALLCLVLLAGVAGVGRADPAVTLSATGFEFGNQIVRIRSGVQWLRITNSGTSPLTIDSVSFTGTNPGDFVLGSDSGEASLGPGATRTLGLQCQATALGARSAVLAISDNAAGSPRLIPLWATGVSTYVNRSPRSLDFGDQYLGVTSDPRTVVIRNDGNTPLHISKAAMGGTNGSDFYADTRNCINVSLQPGATCSIPITFYPRAAGSRTATLYLYDDAPFSPHLVSLAGNGVLNPTLFPAPMIVSATAVRGDPAIYLLWRDNSSGESGFVVEAQVVGSGVWQPVGGASYNETRADIRLRDPIRFGQIYLLRVRAFSDWGYSPWSDEVTADLRFTPIAPSNLTASGTTTAISLSWRNNDRYLDGFEVWRQRAGTDWILIKTLAGEATSFVNYGMTPDVLYTYRVRAIRSGLYSDWSNEARAMLTTTAPAAPTGLTATAASLTRVNLSWSDNSSNETAFAIWRKDSSGVWSRIGLVAPNTTSYADTAAAPNSTYTYRVRATNNVGASAWSNEATATTPGETTPAAPTGLTATAAGATQVSLAWTDNSDNERAFAIWRQEGVIDWRRIAVVAPNVTQYTDSGLTAGTGYLYRVRATNNVGASGWSNDAAVGLVSAPLSALLPRYAITGITLGGKSSFAESINQLGQVTGQAETPDGQSHAFIHDGAGTRSLGPGSSGKGINDLGQVAGTVGIRPYLWDGASWKSLGSFGGSGGIALSINRFGHVVGVDQLSSGGTSHAFLHDGVRMIDLDTLGGDSSVANDINDAGQIVGVSHTAQVDTAHAFLCSNGVMTDLGTLGGRNSIATAIGPAGQVLGQAQLPGSVYNHAFLYSNGVMINLGTLGGEYSCAYDINSSGHIVGSLATPTRPNHAFLWRDGLMFDLNALVLNGSDWELVAAKGINDAGQIVGFGVFRGQYRGFLLTEVADYPPAAPSGLTATATSSRSIALAWTDNSSNETAFAIWRTDSSGVWSRIGVVASNTTAYSDTTVAGGQTYTYRVRATNNDGASAWSNEASVTTRAGP